MDDLVAWCRAQLDDEERLARRAASGCGCHPPTPKWTFGEEATDGRILIVDDPHPDIKRKLTRRWNRSYDGLFMAEHIVRHDPDRALREVEAKRKILDEYARLCEFGRLDGDGQRPSDPALHLAWAAFGKVVKLLAAAVDDRPGYRNEWRP